ACRRCAWCAGASVRGRWTGSRPANGWKSTRRRSSGDARTGDRRRELEGLLVVESRVDRRAVRALEVGFTEPARAADALRDGIPGEFDVHARERRAGRSVQLERVVQFADDVVEAPGLVAR